MRLRATLIHTVRGYCGAVPHIYVSRCWLDPVTVYLVPVASTDDMFLHHSPCPPYPRCHGGGLGNLQPLHQDPLLAVCPNQSAPARFGLVNARLLTNKRFILKDIFTSRELDFLFVIKTWLNPGESSAFTELLPGECCYFNSPRTSGQEVGIATIFKSDFKYKQISLSSVFANFELSLFELRSSHTVLYAVVYHPPKVCAVIFFTSLF